MKERDAGRVFHEDRYEGTNPGSVEASCGAGDGRLDLCVAGTVGEAVQEMFGHELEFGTVRFAGAGELKLDRLGDAHHSSLVRGSQR